MWQPKQGPCSTTGSTGAPKTKTTTTAATASTTHCFLNSVTRTRKRNGTYIKSAECIHLVHKKRIEDVGVKAR
jgi:hypothetical protein